MGVLFQMIGTFVVCSLTMSTGIIIAWPSSTTVLFKSENTTLHRPMSSAEVGLLGSLSSVGALASTPVFAALIDRLGRKNCSMLCGLMNVIGWTLIASSRQVELVMTAVVIAGLGSSGFLIVAVYVAEFCQESIRGAMSSGSMVMYGVGILIAYLTGGLLDYWTNVYVCLTLVIANLALLTWLRESPMFLLMKGLEKEAAMSVAFYRRVEPGCKEVADELETLKRVLNAEKGAIYGHPSEVSVYYGLLLVSVLLVPLAPALPRLLRARGPARDEMTLLNILLLIELATLCLTVGMHNFPLGLTLAALYTPLALVGGVQARGGTRWFSLFLKRIFCILLSPLCVITLSMIVYSRLLFPEEAFLPMAGRGRDAAMQAVMFSVVDSLIYGNWLFNVVTTAILPIWIIFWQILCNRVDEQV